MPTVKYKKAGPWQSILINMQFIVFAFATLSAAASLDSSQSSPQSVVDNPAATVQSDKFTPTSGSSASPDNLGSSLIQTQGNCNCPRTCRGPTVYVNGAGSFAELAQYNQVSQTDLEYCNYGLFDGYGNGSINRYNCPYACTPSASGGGSGSSGPQDSNQCPQGCPLFFKADGVTDITKIFSNTDDCLRRQPPYDQVYNLGTNVCIAVPQYCY
ncbi:hypothetical protein NEOLI_001644 [Neolecta irregularis DAH-3]|uniref:Uncharacterized protein n=1 Tax=Neolecta irregularis (strain DAH-3) TaxID=1198029 RepID=A0A1U7LSU9_NEOID|nr:hypothetical protein NEOLI_001644 [Neolecta irregularis DAH-3]|eukprot:OLL25745.1 hypothetical protein NEOLI_001644 [Neolecta irregularis DAH-3]